MAFSVKHKLKGRLTAGCVPLFTTGGLKQYYSALTALFGKREPGEKKLVWVLLRDFFFGQVVKHQKRRRTVEVELRFRWENQDFTESDSSRQD